MAAAGHQDGVPRVAVIAVHGVADQREGETARAVAELLIRKPPAGVRYGTAHEHTFMLEVDLVRAACDLPDRPGVAGAAPKVRPDHWWQRLRKSWRQSYGSDFHRKKWAVDAAQKADTLVARSPKPRRSAPVPT